jgi:hypothetical protein
MNADKAAKIDSVARYAGLMRNRTAAGKVSVITSADTMFEFTDFHRFLSDVIEVAEMARGFSESADLHAARWSTAPQAPLSPEFTIDTTKIDPAAWMPFRASTEPLIIDGQQIAVTAAEFLSRDDPEDDDDGDDDEDWDDLDEDDEDDDEDEEIDDEDIDEDDDE